MSSKDILENCGVSITTTQDAMKGRDDLKVVESQYKKPTIFIPTGKKFEAIRAGLVPEMYIESDFDIEHVRQNQKEQWKKSSRKFSVKRFDAYKDVTLGILATLTSNQLPKQSYVIGAPNGFGKASFVTTCILKLFEQGRICTPYISLTELAEIKIANERRLIKGLSSRDFYYGNRSTDILEEDYKKELYRDFDSELYSKRPINLISKYSWSEYMNCDVLFCYFTDVSAKILESEMFKTAITIRGAKGLPTIAMISTSLDPYKCDAYLAEHVWNEILVYNDKQCCDRAKHISCYKDYRDPIRQ